jgi:hypothetical protein
VHLQERASWLLTKHAVDLECEPLPLVVSRPGADPVEQLAELVVRRGVALTGGSRGLLRHALAHLGQEPLRHGTGGPDPAPGHYLPLARPRVLHRELDRPHGVEAACHEPGLAGAARAGELVSRPWRGASPGDVERSTVQRQLRLQ